MAKRITAKLSFANVISLCALFVALGGGAYAISKNSVGTKQLKNSAVNSKKIDNGTVKGKDVKKKSLKGRHVKDDSLTGVQIDESTLSQVPSAETATTATNVEGTELFGSGVVKSAATDGATEAAARAAAPEVPLGGKGALRFYGKCFTDTSAPRTYAEIYIATTQDGAVFGSAEDTLEGGPAATDFLNTNTDEDDRQVESESAGTDNANGFRSVYYAMAGDGTAVQGVASVEAKNGTLAGGDGLFGPGSACLFSGFQLGE